MQQLVLAILSTWKTNATTTGQSLYGVFGPFWDLAPEKITVSGALTKVAYPRCVIHQLPSPKPIWGFGAGPYAEYVGIQFMLYASAADASNAGLIQVSGLADSVTSIYDNNRLTLGGGEYCNLARRIGAVMLKKEPGYGGDGLAVYSATATYEYACQRTQS